MKVIAMSMTKRDLVVKIAEKTGLIQQDAAIVIQKLLDSPATETGHVQFNRECSQIELMCSGSIIRLSIIVLCYWFNGTLRLICPPRALPVGEIGTFEIRKIGIFSVGADNS